VNNSSPTAVAELSEQPKTETIYEHVVIAGQVVSVPVDEIRYDGNGRIIAALPCGT